MPRWRRAVVLPLALAPFIASSAGSNIGGFAVVGWISACSSATRRGRRKR